MKTSKELAQLIMQNSDAPVSPIVETMLGEIKAKYADTLCGVLYYGSCLREGEDLSGMLDLYVLVNSYSAAHGPGISALFNHLLPPNVYYLDVELEAGTVRAKYAVISVHDFERAVSDKWFHSYIWGRFAQPVRLVYAVDKSMQTWITHALSISVVTFMKRVIPSLPENFTPSILWQQGLALSYGAELRAEKANRPAQLFSASKSYFTSVADLAMTHMPYAITQTGESTYSANLSAYTRRVNRIAWTVRRVQGKLLSVLRLLKAIFTFRGGVDYIAWKLERHTGEKIEITPEIRRRPLVYGWGLVWSLYRKGVFR